MFTNSVSRALRLASGLALTAVIGMIAPAPLAAQAVVAAPSATVSGSSESFPPPPYYGYGGLGGDGGFGWGWGTTGGIGSTAAGSYLGGLGMAIRAQGQYNLMTSEAAINLEEARRRAIENREKWTNTYFEMRRINRSYREAERGPRLTQADWVRIAQETAPRRVASHELDRVTGQIAWPSALRADAFAQDRANIEQLFAERAHAEGAIGHTNYDRIRIAVNAALENLRGRIRDINPRSYMEARNFLTGLAREADFPTS
ncbi:MAG: hypothetical protein AB7O59_07100 [Pirellulales bacterium]